MVQTSNQKTVEVKVRIDYFKPTGKWYSSAEIFRHVSISNGTPASWEVSRHITQLRECGVRPGLENSKECGLVWVVCVVYAGEVTAQFLWLPEYLDVLARDK